MEKFQFQIEEQAVYAQRGTVTTEADNEQQALENVLSGNYEHKGDNEVLVEAGDDVISRLVIREDEESTELASRNYKTYPEPIKPKLDMAFDEAFKTLSNVVDALRSQLSDGFNERMDSKDWALLQRISDLVYVRAHEKRDIEELLRHILPTLPEH